MNVTFFLAIASCVIGSGPAVALRAPSALHWPPASPSAVVLARDAEPSAPQLQPSAWMGEAGRASRVWVAAASPAPAPAAQWKRGPVLLSLAALLGFTGAVLLAASRPDRDCKIFCIDGEQAFGFYALVGAVGMGVTGLVFTTIDYGRSQPQS